MFLWAVILQVHSSLHSRATVLQKQQNRLLPNKGSGSRMSGFVKVSGGTGVFHPRVSNTTISTNNATGDVKKKQGESDILIYVQAFAFYFGYVLWSWFWGLSSVQIGVYSSICFETCVVCLCFSLTRFTLVSYHSIL